MNHLQTLLLHQAQNADICHSASSPTCCVAAFSRAHTPDTHACLSPPSTESVDREDDPHPLPSSSRDLPLGRGGKERSGEELRQPLSRHPGGVEREQLSRACAPSSFYRAECVCLQVEVSPIENAVYVVENKTQELRTLISQYQHRQHQGNINPLSMCLNGVIDAAVNGGIARYQEVKPGFTDWTFSTLSFVVVQQAFFDKDYISSHTEDTERITHLKDLMQEQVRGSFELIVCAEGLHTPASDPASPRALAGSHSGSGAGRSREAGARGDASAPQEARGPVSRDEDGVTPCEFCGFLEETRKVGCFVCS